MTAPVGPLFTDFYELTMMAGYLEQNQNRPATFSLSIRPNRARRNFFIAAGLQTAVTTIASWRFSHEEIAYLEGLHRFSGQFLNWLSDFRFSGDIRAVSEGSVVFGNEPLLEVTAPMMEAQLLETYLINAIGFSSLIATKAARCMLAADGRPMVDFSLRRTQGTDAGMMVARSSWLAGFAGTSNVAAARQFAIPVSGTMAHSFVTAFGSDEKAFRAFAATFPDDTVLLIDTFDAIKGAESAAALGQAMAREGKSLRGVRLDSGDMVSLSLAVRKILDDAGLSQAKIFASSGFDEYQIRDVIEKGAAIDAFGVGTRMGVSADVPYNDTVYKLVRFDGRDVKKFSPGKVTLAGEKQVFRAYDATGRMKEDRIGTAKETMEGFSPLLAPVMEKGTILPDAFPDLTASRIHCANELRALPGDVRSLERPADYPVTITPALSAIQKAVDSA